MKRAVIVHCWGGEPNYAWYPWVAKHLEAKGFKVSVPEMPDSEEPKLDKWLPHLKDVIGDPDEDLVLIGHSLGCATIMRYLETLTEKQKVGKVIFVAGFTDAIGFRELEDFFEKPIEFEKIRSKSAEGFVAIQSDDDPYVVEQYGTRLEEELGAELLIKQEAGHMSGSVVDKDSCTELPEVVKEATGEPVHMPKRRFPKAIRTAFASAIVLVVLFAGGGLAYTYYSGKNSADTTASAADAAASTTAAANQPVKAARTSSKTPEGVAINLLSSPVARGAAASMSVQTLPYSRCTIVVTYGKALAHAAGLGAVTADDFGTASWNWTVSPSTPVGKGMAAVTCSRDKKTAVVEGDLQVTAK